MATARSNWKYVPLGLVLALHVIVAESLVPWSEAPRVLPAWKNEIAQVLFPIQISLIAIWLALQPRLWQSLPWALVATALSVNWYLPVYSPQAGDWVMPFLMPLGGVCLLVTTRTLQSQASTRSRFQLGMRDMLVWVTAIAILMVLARERSYQIWSAWKRAEAFGSVQLYVLYAIITAEYVLMAQTLLLMVIRGCYLRWIVPFCLLALPALMLLESTLVMVIFDFPFFFDPESWIYAGCFVAILSASLLAWRHSGLLITESNVESDR